MPGISSFEKQLEEGLVRCGLNPALFAEKEKSIAAAVSGGADSVSLLKGLASISKVWNFKIKVISINHNIRSPLESSGDVNFVKDLCSSLKKKGIDLDLYVHELERGQIASLAREKNCGTEAAARELRYKAFEEFLQKEKIDYLCLAHNYNDQLETILMKFLQGGGSSALAGIPCVRGPFIRPLLWTPRADIEEYLKEEGQTWCMDSTNSDSSYLRNRIRNELLPLLNDRFPGWDKAVLNGLEKEGEDFACLNALARDFYDKNVSAVQEGGLGQKVEKSETILKINGPAFYSLDRAIKKRVLLQAFNSFGIDRRIPYVFLRDICDYADNYIEDSGKESAVKEFAGINVELKKKEILIKKAERGLKESAFSVIIEKAGTYEFPFGKVTVPELFEFPVLLRSSRPDDQILTAQGNLRSVADIFSDWHVEEALRRSIPLVQTLDNAQQRIAAILGKDLGYKDWIVKLDYENE